MVKKIIIQKIMTDEEVSQYEGKWIDESFIKIPIIKSDTDVYYLDENNNEKLLLKFRKRVISDKLINIGWNSYKNLAKASRGRGASAGPINSESHYWKKRRLVKTNKWSTGYLTPKGNELYDSYFEKSLEDLIKICSDKSIKLKDNPQKEDVIISLVTKDGGVSKMKVNNQVASNPIGYYEGAKNFADLPCRLTHFTRTNFEKYNEGLKFIQRIDTLFKKLIPDAHQRQLERANTKPHLKIPKTSFSTITINRNFRTALHRDAGDFKGGFGNLTVIERGKYHFSYRSNTKYLA